MQGAGEWCDCSMGSVPAVPGEAGLWFSSSCRIQGRLHVSADGWITCPGTWEDAAAQKELVAPKLSPGFWDTDSLLILEVLVGSCGFFLLELVGCVLRTSRKESLQCQTLFSVQKRIVSAYEVLPVFPVGLQGCCGVHGVWSRMEFSFHSTLSLTFRAVLGGFLGELFKGKSVDGLEIPKFIVHRTTWIYKPWHDREMGCELLLQRNI